MNTVFPIWLISIDYILGFLMLVLIIKFILNLFITEGSHLRFFRFFTKITEPILNSTSKITPNFVVKPIIPIYLAWLLFMLRIYFLPLVIGFSAIGNFAFLFEKDIISLINTTILNMALYLNYGL